VAVRQASCSAAGMVTTPRAMARLCASGSCHGIGLLDHGVVVAEPRGHASKVNGQKKRKRLPVLLLTISIVRSAESGSDVPW